MYWLDYALCIYASINVYVQYKLSIVYYYFQ